MNYEELKAFLMTDASFDEKQWRELSAICEIRQGNYTAARTGMRMEQVDVGEEHVRLFYDRLKSYLLDHKFCGVAPLNVLKKTQLPQYRAVKKVAGKLYELAGKWNTTGRNHRNFSIGIYHLYVQLVVEYLQEARVPVSAKTVLQHLDKFEGLVDRAYPGYIENDLLPLIVFGKMPSTSTN